MTDVASSTSVNRPSAVVPVTNAEGNTAHAAAVVLVGLNGNAALPASPGAKAAGSSLSVTQAGLEYEAVPASSTDIALGATGAAGDFLSHIIIQPATTAAATCTVKDGTTVIYTFTGGTLGDLRPIIVPFNLFSTSGAWKITTGTNVAILGIGDFT
jgi:hypothetical protein